MDDSQQLNCEMMGSLFRALVAKCSDKELGEMLLSTETNQVKQVEKQLTKRHSVKVTENKKELSGFLIPNVNLTRMGQAYSIYDNESTDPNDRDPNIFRSNDDDYVPARKERGGTRSVPTATISTPYGSGGFSGDAAMAVTGGAIAIGAIGIYALIKKHLD